MRIVAGARRSDASGRGPWLGVAALAAVVPPVAMAPAPAVAKVPKPTVTVAVSQPTAVARGQVAKVAVRVVNRGRSRVGGLRLSVAPAKGVSARLAGVRGGRLSRALPALKGRRRLSVAVSLTPGAKAAGRSKTTVTLRRGGRLVARRAVTLSVRGASAPTPPAPAPAPAPSPAPAAPANPLVGRYFYRTYLVGAGMYYDTFYFANAGLAYRGRPAGGLPDCPAATVGDTGDGCVPYTYDAATGAVGVDGRTGALIAPHVLKLGAYSFSEAITPAAGTPLDVYVHSLSGSGVCGVDCGFVARQIKFAPDGQFARSTAITASTPEGDFAALPAGQHGTYAILPGGKLQLSYADGSSLTETIGFMLDDADQPNPSYGLLLDGTIYWGPVSGV